MPPGFVDCHSHVVPSGDDGAQTFEEGLELCELAAQTGTELLYATREESVHRAFERLREEAPLELRLGFELTPCAALEHEDPHRYVLEGTSTVLVEVPFLGPPDGFFALCEHIE